MVTRIRNLTARDIEGILRLQEICHKPTLRENVQALLSKITLSPTTCYGIELENTGLIAYGLAFPCDEVHLTDLNAITSQSSFPNTLYIHDIAVEPSMRSGGLGAQILQHMVSDAIRLGLPTLTLTAIEGASDYWLHHGFQKIDGVALGYGQGAIQMRLSIPMSRASAKNRT